MASKIFTYICITFVAMMGFFIDIENSPSGYNIKSVTSTYAADTGTGSQSYDKEKEMLDSLVSGINVALSIVTIIVTPAIILASWLMSPDWTSGDLFNMRPVIHDMWILISNVTYFIYAILLIIIALATIFNSQNYGYKILLPRLALGIILVPLTWWFIQFTISLASIVTASVMNIPADIVINKNKPAAATQNSWWTEKSIPNNIRYNNTKKPGEETPKVDCTQTGACMSPADFLTPTGGGGVYGSLVVYAFAVFKVQDIKEIRSQLDLVKTPFQLVHQLIVGGIMFIVFGLLVMALIVLLFMRAVKLWFYAMFSPLMTLKFVLGDKIFGKESESFDLKEFIGLAFVPAIVGLALSFGLVVVSMLMHKQNDGNKFCTSPTDCTITLFGNTKSTIQTKIDEANKTTETVVTLGNLKYTFEGAVTGTNKGATLNGALDMSAGIVGTIIVDIIALIFIWIAFMAAKGVSKVASAAFEPFEQLGSKLSKLPKYAPIPFTGGMSMNGMERVGSDLNSMASKAEAKRYENSFIGKQFGAEKRIPQDVAEAVISKINQDKLEEKDYSEIKNKIAPYINRENAYDSGIPAAVVDKIGKLKDNTTERTRFMEKLGITDESNQKKLIEYAKKGALVREDDKKEVIGMLRTGGNTSGGAGTGGNSASKNLTITNDGKGFNIGTVNISTSLSSNPEEIAKKLKESGIGGGASLKEKYTEQELRNIMLQADQFQGDNNKKKLDELIEKLGKDYFKKADDSK